MLEGKVVSVSVGDGIQVLLEHVDRFEDVEIGSILVIEGGDKLYLCLIDDISSGVDRDLLSPLSQARENRVREVLWEYAYEESIKFLRLIPLAEKRGVDPPREASSLPPVSSPIARDQEKAIKMFFGQPDFKSTFPIGRVSTLDRGVKGYLPIDIKALNHLSFGIFGKSGTGKTFLANLLITYTHLYMVRDRESNISLLVFDTQGEYSGMLMDDMGREVLPGAFMKASRLPRPDTRIYSIDPDVLNKYGVNGSVLKIPLKGISIRDLLVISSGLGLTETFMNSLGSFKGKAEAVLERLGESYSFLSASDWLLPFIITYYNLDRYARYLYNNGTPLISNNGNFPNSLDDLKSALEELINEFKREIGETSSAWSSVEANIRRLSMLSYAPTSFLSRDLEKYNEIAKKLLEDDNISIVINLSGRYGRSPHVYMAIANLVGEKLINQVDEKVLREGEVNKKVVIYLEEAHRFLGRGVIHQNPFGRVAREYRKYGLIVVPIDQKPSELDDDVVSMLWGKFIFNIIDNKDVDSVVHDLPMRSRFKGLVPRLPRGRVVFYSHLMRYPIVVDTLDILNDKLDFDGENLSIYAILERVVENESGREVFRRGRGPIS